MCNQIADMFNAVLMRDAVLARLSLGLNHKQKAGLNDHEIGAGGRNDSADGLLSFCAPNVLGYATTSLLQLVTHVAGVALI